MGDIQEWIYNSLTVMTGYIYDADGQRVAKGAITSMSCDPTVNGFATQSDYVRDQSGNQLSEFTLANGSPEWVHTNVYASGDLMATDDTNETHFYLNDWLGTRRPAFLFRRRTCIPARRKTKRRKAA